MRSYIRGLDKELVTVGITYNKQSIKKDRVVVGSSPRDRQNKQSALVSSPYGIDWALVEELKSHILSLQGQLNNKSVSSNGWTDEQVNSEIEKVIKSETQILKAQHVIELSKAEEKIRNLENRLDTLELEFNGLAQDNKNLLSTIETIKVSKIELESEIYVLKEQVKSKDELIQVLKDTQLAGSNFSEEKLTALFNEATKNITLSMSPTVEDNRPKMETSFIDPVENSGNVEAHITISEVSIIEKEEMNSKVNKLKGLLGKLPNKRG